MYGPVGLFIVIFILALCYFFRHLQHSITLRKTWLFKKGSEIIVSGYEKCCLAMVYCLDSQITGYLLDFYGWLDRVYFSVAETRHPGFLMIHTSLIVGGVSLFFYDVWSRLQHDNEYLVSLYLVIVTILAACLSQTYWTIVNSDPGYIDLDNHTVSMSRFDYDNVLFRPTVCSTCQFVRPARSKHCRYCSRCILLMDHHCIWLNICIGERNHLAFIKYLFSLLTTVFVGMVLGLRAIWLEVVRSGVAHRLVTYSGPNLAHLPPASLGFKNGLIYTCQRMPLTTIVVVISFSTMLVVGFFMIVHLTLACSGLTTYERDKAHHLSALFDCEKCIYTKDMTITERLFTVIAA